MLRTKRLENLVDEYNKGEIDESYFDKALERERESQRKVLEEVAGISNIENPTEVVVAAENLSKKGIPATPDKLGDVVDQIRETDWRKESKRIDQGQGMVEKQPIQPSAPPTYYDSDLKTSQEEVRPKDVSPKETIKPPEYAPPESTPLEVSTTDTQGADYSATDKWYKDQDFNTWTKGAAKGVVKSVMTGAGGQISASASGTIKDSEELIQSANKILDNISTGKSVPEEARKNIFSYFNRPEFPTRKILKAMKSDSLNQEQVDLLKRYVGQAKETAQKEKAEAEYISEGVETVIDDVTPNLPPPVNPVEEVVRATFMEAPQMAIMMGLNALMPGSGLAFMGQRIAGGMSERLRNAGVNPQNAWQIGVLASLPSTLLEKTGLDVIANKIPKRALSAAAGGLAEGVTEWLQGLSEEVIFGLASKGDTPKEKLSTISESFKTFAKQGYVDFLVGTAMGTPISAATFSGNQRNQAKANLRKMQEYLRTEGQGQFLRYVENNHGLDNVEELKNLGNDSEFKRIKKAFAKDFERGKAILEAKAKRARRGDKAQERFDVAAPGDLITYTEGGKPVAKGRVLNRKGNKILVEGGALLRPENIMHLQKPKAETPQGPERIEDKAERLEDSFEDPAPQEYESVETTTIDQGNFPDTESELLDFEATTARQINQLDEANKKTKKGTPEFREYQNAREQLENSLVIAAKKRASLKADQTIEDEGAEQPTEGLEMDFSPEEDIETLYSKRDNLLYEAEIATSKAKESALNNQIEAIDEIINQKEEAIYAEEDGREIEETGQEEGLEGREEEKVYIRDDAEEDRLETGPEIQQEVDTPLESIPPKAPLEGAQDTPLETEQTPLEAGQVEKEVLEKTIQPETVEPEVEKAQPTEEAPAEEAKPSLREITVTDEYEVQNPLAEAVPDRLRNAMSNTGIANYIQENYSQEKIDDIYKRLRRRRKEALQKIKQQKAIEEDRQFLTDAERNAISNAQDVAAQTLFIMRKISPEAKKKRGREEGQLERYYEKNELKTNLQKQTNDNVKSIVSELDEDIVSDFVEDLTPEEAKEGITAIRENKKDGKPAQKIREEIGKVAGPAVYAEVDPVQIADDIEKDVAKEPGIEEDVPFADFEPDYFRYANGLIKRGYIETDEDGNYRLTNKGEKNPDPIKRVAKKLQDSVAESGSDELAAELNSLIPKAPKQDTPETGDVFEGTEAEDRRTKGEKAIDRERQKKKEEKTKKQREGDLTKGTPLFDKEEQEAMATKQEDVFVKPVKEGEDVSDRTGTRKQDSKEPGAEQPGDEEVVQDDRGRVGKVGAGEVPAIAEEGAETPASDGGSGNLAASIRESSNIEILPEGKQPDSQDAIPGDYDGRGSDISLPEGEEFYDEAGTGRPDEGTPKEGSDKLTSFKEKFRAAVKLQKEVENTPVKIMDKDNIDETLPVLFEEQKGDVLNIETRFNDPKHKKPSYANGKGYLVTNGTGTGKTYTGLGAIKRMVKQGKKDALIVVTSQEKAGNWIGDAETLNLKVNRIKNTKDAGKDVSVTTYQNFRKNKAIKKRDFDIIVYDESHKIMDNKSGNYTSTTYAHFENANANQRYAFQKKTSVHPLWEKADELRGRDKELEKKAYSLSSDSPKMKEITRERNKIDEELKRIGQEQKAIEPKLIEEAKEATDKTKVIFLSATPFKSHLNLRYANNFLFNWDADANQNLRQAPEEQFFLEHFSAKYEYKNNRLQTKSDENPNATALQEIKFSDNMQEVGISSGRLIDSEMDYSREFPLITGFDNKLFNKAFAEIFAVGEEAKYPGLREKARQVFVNGQYAPLLFESMKAGFAIDRIKDHLKLGRKVVIFNRRLTGDVKAPFKDVLDRAEMEAKAKLEVGRGDVKESAQKTLDEIESFKEDHSKILEYEQTIEYKTATKQLADAFKDRVVFFNGDVSTRQRSKNILDFNNDNSGKDIIVLQEDAGKEGLSLHDKTGNKQRVLINLSLPNSSTTALQTEGRVYRLGQESNAILEYPFLGLDLETAYFGSSLNAAVSTTENLAIGSKARDLLRSFKDGALSATTQKPSKEQGVGGKEFDKKVEAAEASPFEMAKLKYDMMQKMRGKRTERMGEDLYPTPEPVGFKMVEWLGLKAGDSVLEPSAGTGAIAQWVQQGISLTAVEPSFDLYGKLSVNVNTGNAKILQTDFEDFSIKNKFNGIAMNPPFVGGKAIKHLKKAFRHLKDGGRIAAIIPEGKAAKDFDEWLESDDLVGAFPVATIKLPQVTFEKAGTKVRTKIIVLDKAGEDLEHKVPNYRELDFTNITNINDLFDSIEDVSLDPPPGYDLKTTAEELVNDIDNETTSVGDDKDFSLQTDEGKFNVVLKSFLDRKNWLAMNKIAKNNNGKYYGGKKRQNYWQFDNKADALKTLKEYGGQYDVEIDSLKDSAGKNEFDEKIASINFNLPEETLDLSQLSIDDAKRVAGYLSKYLNIDNSAQILLPAEIKAKDIFGSEDYNIESVTQGEYNQVTAHRKGSRTMDTGFMLQHGLNLPIDINKSNTETLVRRAKRYRDAIDSVSSTVGIQGKNTKIRQANTMPPDREANILSLFKRDYVLKKFEEFKKIVYRAGRFEEVFKGEAYPRNAKDDERGEGPKTMYFKKQQGSKNFSEGRGITTDMTEKEYPSTPIQGYRVTEEGYKEAIESLTKGSQTDKDFLEALLPHFLHDFIKIRRVSGKIDSDGEGSIGFDSERNKIVISINEDASPSDIALSFSHEIGGHLLLSNVLQKNSDLKKEAVRIGNEYNRLFGRSIKNLYANNIEAAANNAAKRYGGNGRELAALDYEFNEILARLIGLRLHKKMRGQDKTASDPEFENLYNRVKNSIGRIWDAIKKGLKNLINKITGRQADVEAFEKAVDDFFENAFQKMNNLTKSGEEFTLFYQWQVNPSTDSEYGQAMAYTEDSLRMKNIAKRQLAGDENIPIQYSKKQEPLKKALEYDRIKYWGHQIGDVIDDILKDQHNKIINNVNNYQYDVSQLFINLSKEAESFARKNKVPEAIMGHHRYLLKQKDAFVKKVFVDGVLDIEKFNEASNELYRKNDEKIIELVAKHKTKTKYQVDKYREKLKQKDIKIKEINKIARDVMSSQGLSSAGRTKVRSWMYSNEPKPNAREKTFEKYKESLLNKIVDISQKETMDNAIQKLKKAIKRIPSDIEEKYQQQINSLIEKIDFTKLSERKYGELEKIRNLIDEEMVKPFMLPSKVTDELKRLEKINIKEFTPDTLREITETINMVVEQWRLKNKLRMERIKKDYQISKNVIIENISSRPKYSREWYDPAKYSIYLRDKAKGSIVDLYWGSGRLTPEMVAKTIEFKDTEAEGAELGRAIIKDSYSALNTKIVILDKFTELVGEKIKENNIGKLEDISLMMREKAFEQGYKWAEENGLEFGVKKPYEHNNIFEKTLGELKEEGLLTEKVAKSVTSKNENDVPEKYLTKTLRLTKAEAMDVYLHTKNPHNVKAIIQNGVAISHLVNYKKDSVIEMSMVDIENISNYVESRPGLKNVADTIFNYLNKENKDLINSASEFRSGKRLATEENYWGLSRINTYKNYLTKGIDLKHEDGQLTAIENNPMLMKRNPNAAGTVVIRDAFDAAFAAANLGATYNAYSRFYGKAMQLLNDSDIKEVINSKDLNNYWESLQKHVEGLISKGLRRSELDKFAGKISRNAMVSILAQNPFVWVNQLVSYPTAAFYMNVTPKPISPTDIKRWQSYITKYSPQIKSRLEKGLINYEVGTRSGAATLREAYGGKTSLKEYQLMPIRATDKWAILSIVKDCYNIVAKENPELFNRSEAQFGMAVAAKADEVIRRTQPMRSKEHRSLAGNADRPIERILVAFMSALNALENANYNSRMDRDIDIERSKKMVRTRGKKEARKMARQAKNRHRLNWFKYYMLGGLIMNILESIKSLWKEDRREVKDVLLYQVTYPFQSKYFGKDVAALTYDFFDKQLFDPKKYEGKSRFIGSNVLSSTIMDLVEGATAFTQAIANTVKGDETQKPLLNQWGEFGKEAMSIIGKFTGVGIENIFNIGGYLMNHLNDNLVDYEIYNDMADINYTPILSKPVLIKEQFVAKSGAIEEVTISINDNVYSDWSLKTIQVADQLYGAYKKRLKKQPELQSFSGKREFFKELIRESKEVVQAQMFKPIYNLDFETKDGVKTGFLNYKGKKIPLMEIDKERLLSDQSGGITFLYKNVRDIPKEYFGSLWEKDYINIKDVEYDTELKIPTKDLSVVDKKDVMKAVKGLNVHKTGMPLKSFLVEYGEKKVPGNKEMAETVKEMLRNIFEGAEK